MSQNALKQLRAFMKNTKYVNEVLQAYIIPSADAHGSEYLAACDERRAFISGFSGSAGTAVVTHSDALLWTDARYYLQAERQLSQQWTLMKDGAAGVPSQGAWLASTLPGGSVVGVDPRLLSARVWDTLSAELETGGLSLQPVSANLVDLVWTDRPQRPSNLVSAHPVKYSGMAVSEKLAEVRRRMQHTGVSLLVLAALDEIAYMLNLRGSDIDYNPVFFAYCAVELDSVHLFIEADKLPSAVKQHLLDEATETVQLHDYDDVWQYCQKKAGCVDGKVWLCPLASRALTSMFSRRQRHVDRTPPCTMKAIKNDTEIAGMYAAHIRDAVALCTYLCWLEEQVLQGELITEMSGAKKLDLLRAEQDDFVGLSFTTISASGPNAAVIHYSPSEDTDRAITADQIYLVDSGAQYRDGTTDVTRTVHFGRASRHQQECYTRVLKGHLALAAAVFPDKTRGTLLDPLARLALWQVGLDYGHGTGHGIGSFLNVHEGPITIHSRPQPANEPGLQAGMFVSDEPGYYEAGSFGVRIENIVQVVKARTAHNFGGRDFLTFRHVTLVPIQTSLILPELLSEHELCALNAYHAECREKVGAALRQQGRDATYKWLLSRTEPLG